MIRVNTKTYSDSRKNLKPFAALIKSQPAVITAYIASNSKKMNSMTQIRNDRLIQLSQMVVDGEITYKLDHIATININGRHYFTVFRRYNSQYDIVIEDYNGDIYLHQDNTIRRSLQGILCLLNVEAANIYTLDATSYKHNGPVPSLSCDIADLQWSHVHADYHAISVNFGGILQAPAPFFEQEPPSTPIAQIRTTPENPPGAPERPIKTEEIEAAHALLSLSIPQVENPFALRECDAPTLSMRFADINKRYEHASCYCHMDESDEGEDEFDPYNYTELRSGRLVPK